MKDVDHPMMPMMPVIRQVTANDAYIIHEKS